MSTPDMVCNTALVPLRGLQHRGTRKSCRYTWIGHALGSLVHMICPKCGALLPKATHVRLGRWSWVSAAILGLVVSAGTIWHERLSALRTESCDQTVRQYVEAALNILVQLRLDIASGASVQKNRLLRQHGGENRDIGEVHMLLMKSERLTRKCLADPGTKAAAAKQIRYLCDTYDARADDLWKGVLSTDADEAQKVLPVLDQLVQGFEELLTILNGKSRSTNKDRPTVSR